MKFILVEKISEHNVFVNLFFCETVAASRIAFDSRSINSLLLLDTDFRDP